MTEHLSVGEENAGTGTGTAFASFRHAAKVLYPLEKGFAEDDNNRGSVNFGITEYFLGLIGDRRKPIELTWEDCKELYKKHFWLAWRLDKVHAGKQHAANYLFASFVNTSPQHVAMAAQKALTGCGFSLKHDGMFGPITLHALNTCNQPLFVWNFYHFLQAWYEFLADKNKYVLDQKTGETKMVKPNAKFLPTWTARNKYLYLHGASDNPPGFDPKGLSLYRPVDPRKRVET